MGEGSTSWLEIMLPSWVWSSASQKSFHTSSQERVLGEHGQCNPCTLLSGLPSSVFAPGTSSNSTKCSVGLKCSCGARAVLRMVEQILEGIQVRGSSTNHKGYLGVTCYATLSLLWPACHMSPSPLWRAFRESCERFLQNLGQAHCCVSMDRSPPASLERSTEKAFQRGL